jgi:regulatory protein
MRAAGRSIFPNASAKPPDTPGELKARALRHLARREHSRAELARKLSPHAESQEILEGVLGELERGKLLSNHRFAEMRAHILSRKYGVARIRQDLKSKGVPDDIVAGVSAAGELERAQAILKKKYREPATTREERARRARFLQGRGFSHDTIRSVLATEPE